MKIKNQHINNKNEFFFVITISIFELNWLLKKIEIKYVSIFESIKLIDDRSSWNFQSKNIWQYM